MKSMIEILSLARQLNNVIGATMEDTPGMAHISVKNIAVTPAPWFKNYIGIIMVNLSKHQIEIIKEQTEDANYRETVEVAKKLSSLLEWRLKTTKY